MTDGPDRGIEQAKAGRRAKKLGEAASRTDSRPGLVATARFIRRLLPGDERYGDALSTSGDALPQHLGRLVTELRTERPSAMRELGLGVLQAWQALSEAQRRGRGVVDVAILFTDLVGFSSWALEAGDEAALELERLLTPISVAGHSPQLRAGVHLGRPRQIGGDYLGVDVNIAARVGDAAKPGEILVSESALARLDPAAFEFGRKRRLKAPGAPRELTVCGVRAAGA